MLTRASQAIASFFFYQKDEDHAKQLRVSFPFCCGLFGVAVASICLACVLGLLAD